MPAQQRTVLITGATGGLGQSLARRLVRDGDDQHVVLGVRDARRGESLRATLAADFPSATFSVLVMDVADVASVRGAVTRLETTLDAVVLNAGGTGGPRPFERTADGVTQVMASNLLGHAALVEALVKAGRLTGTVEMVGSEAAFGVRALHLPAPEVGPGSVEEFAAWLDGTAGAANGALAYGQVKLLSALWIGAQARQHPHLRFVTMSPGNTAGTGVHRDLPLPLRLLIPRIAPLLKLNHPLAVGTERLATALLDPAYGEGRFWASAPGKVTGPVVDQAEAHPWIADPRVQANAAEAVRRFLTTA